MQLKVRFAYTLALLLALQAAVLAVVLLSLLLDEGPAQRALLFQLLARKAPVLAVVGLLLLAALGFGLRKLFHAWPAALDRLSEEVVLIATDPRHRFGPQGAQEVRTLIGKLNQLAAVHQSMREEVDQKIALANSSLSDERNRLAALMSDLALSVLVCNADSRIVLYNQRAVQLLGGRQDAVGLGRPLSGLLDAGQLAHALDQVRHQLAADRKNAAQAVAVFVATLQGGQVVRAQVAPVLDSGAAFSGFVLTLEDITRRIEEGSRRGHLLQSLGRHTRAALGNIRAAVETMRAFPAMGPDIRAQLAAVIDEESLRLTRGIDGVEELAAQAQDTRWELEDLRGADLLALLERRIDAPGLLVVISGAADPSLWLHADSFALANALGRLARRLAFDAGVSELHLGLQRAGRLALLSLSWDDAPLPAETLRSWEGEMAPDAGAGSAQSLMDVVAQHGGETVYRAGAAHQSSYALLLPLIESRIALDVPRGGGAAAFYDFDLFQQRGQVADLDQRRLSQLGFTVFDTETTGLLPAEGDEIIAIGAVRIVNGRLLAQERFERLVQPTRPPSDESVAVHGLAATMLAGQPRIGEVLGEFERFIDDTVLVAHNAGFDMRFLQMQEATAGVTFTQPVLDTLLLSQVIHPNQQQHSLEAIAARLGVEVTGRHTALGDAVVTGAVFLAMIPLLAGKGIFTLAQARDASQRTLYARVRY